MRTGYTVWMDGTMIGETSLELSHGEGRRAGVFHPSFEGLALLPGVTAMPRALLDAGRMCRQRGLDPQDPALDTDDNVTAILETPEGRRIMEAAKIGVRLELRDSRGDLVPWQSLLISDLNDFRRRARAGDTGSAPESAGDEDSDPIRYFISAKLQGPHARGGHPLPGHIPSARMPQ